jgi:hypothetical protein
VIRVLLPSGWACQSTRKNSLARFCSSCGSYQPDLFIEDLVALRELFLKEIGQVFRNAPHLHPEDPLTARR